MRAMGLDLGTKTIGVAISDPMYWIAQAYTTIQRTNLQEDLKSIQEIVDKEGVQEVVLGLPWNMNHSQGAAADRTKTFGQALARFLGREVIYQDERLSTVSAERILQESGVRREKRKKHVDKIAATFILQVWLDERATRQKTND
uniref:Holliday junction resolvase RuvX n=1 Tax=Ndongobacter massiliensis TaxID=1871025 RepID=UPI0009301EF9|nr:Holliday junction resolvase RuvX [Ndongobacter massiliensis]